MTRPADEVPLLMALRVKGRATSSAIAVAAGVSEDQARVGIGAACGRGAAEGAGGACREGSYQLTEAGRSELAALLAAEEFDRALLAALYEEFLTIDLVLKQRVTAWQLLAPERRGVGATDGLRLAGTEGCALVERMARVAPRYAPYVTRLRAALEALARGDGRFVAGTQVGSLHQVWFELHQDLLLTLGRPRTPCARTRS